MGAPQAWAIPNTTAFSVTFNITKVYTETAYNTWAIVKNGGGTVVSSVVVPANSVVTLYVSTDPTTLIGGNTYHCAIAAVATAPVRGTPISLPIIEIVTTPPIINDSFQRADTVSTPGTIAAPDTFTFGTGTYIVDAVHAYAHVSSHKLVTDVGTYNEVAARYDTGQTNATMIATIGTVDANAGHGWNMAFRCDDYHTFICVIYLAAHLYYIVESAGGQTIIATESYPQNAGMTANTPSVGDVIKAQIDGSNNLSVWVTPAGLSQTFIATHAMTGYTHNSDTVHGWGADAAGWALTTLEIVSP